MEQPLREDRNGVQCAREALMETVPRAGRESARVPTPCGQQAGVGRGLQVPEDTSCSLPLMGSSGVL